MSMFFNWRKNKNNKDNKQDKIEYCGTKNKTSFTEFVDMCKLTQKQLKAELLNMLYRNGYENVVLEDGYIYAKGTIPVLLTAHMDTVHKEQIKDFYEHIDSDGRHLLSSPQGIGGDDRCGTYIIKKIVETTNLRPSILFCEDEEIGGIGSRKFCKTEYTKELEELHYFIEIDRANEKDAVFYECGNKEFQEFICNTTGYKLAYGSFSDICNLSDETDIASVNLSCGYYNAHTTAEYVVVEEMLATMQVITDLLCVESKQYAYEPEVKSYGGYYGSYGGYFGNYYSSKYDTTYDDYFADKYQTKETTEKEKEKDNKTWLVVEVFLEDGSIIDAYGETVEDALCSFFMENGTVCFNDIIDYEVYVC